ncbi:hypothetical protein EI427_11465 [Flammeovirga pectinis]|uniref:Uncharacterized protein n=1 Tax=Flammeovirga pectinis TaxID=2494373 RepID=A0A3Q9FR63_9BACT|nr:hypothetical protein [Flammeovirga pectinis]AZQ62829.1 hypothetical protein EI427_11465 [Flammeovirga pectinis]
MAFNDQQPNMGKVDKFVSFDSAKYANLERFNILEYNQLTEIREVTTFSPTILTLTNSATDVGFVTDVLTEDYVRTNGVNFGFSLKSDFSMRFAKQGGEDVLNPIHSSICGMVETNLVQEIIASASQYGTAIPYTTGNEYQAITIAVAKAKSYCNDNDSIKIMCPTLDAYLIEPLTKDDGLLMGVEVLYTDVVTEILVTVKGYAIVNTERSAIYDKFSKGGNAEAQFQYSILGKYSYSKSEDFVYKILES